MTRNEKILSRTVVALLTSAVALAGAPVAATGQVDGGTVAGLEDLFVPGTLFHDRNNDRVIDAVDTALVIGEPYSNAEMAAAIDVAARLGFETMAMDLPVPREGLQEGVGIVIGHGGLRRLGIEVPELDTLEDGEGLITRIRDGAVDWIVIAGADDAGTRAAAAAFAGRLPHVGTPSGTELPELLDDLRAFLAAAEVRVESLRVPSVRSNVTAAGSFTRLDVEIAVSSDEDVAKGLGAFEGVPQRRQRAEQSEEPHDDEALLSYPGAEVLRLAVRGPGAGGDVTIARVEPEPPSRPAARRPGSGGKADLDLSNLFDADGLLGDSDNNVIPDRIDALLSVAGPGAEPAIDLAARLGLESAGITLPLGRQPSAIADPDSEPTLVVVGRDHPLLGELIEAGKIDAARLESLGADEGLIQVVPEAFGTKRALVVTGGGTPGLRRALTQLSERFPHLWETGKDRATVDDVELAAWRFLAQHSPGGQAAGALYKLDRMVEQLSGRALVSASVTLSLAEIEDGLEAVVRERLAPLGIEDLEVRLDDRNVERAAVLFDEQIEIPSEVDDFWRRFDDAVLPSVRAGEGVRVEARLSEPPEVRARLAAAATARLVEAGADPATTRVVVLSAFKQGFSWLQEAIGPELAALEETGAGPTIGGIRINFAETAAPEEWPQQAMFSKVRWLKEIWPIDEVLATDLAIDRELIDFAMTPVDSPTYEVVATGVDGSELLRRTYEPKYVLRPHYDRFDDYEMVRVTTGWIVATSGERTLVDERIVTDLERFWDHYQAVTLPALYDYVMERHEGNPRDGDGPYFGELTVEVSLSEPDYLLGIDKEYISSLDSLHEEVYFPTLFFFRMLGRMARGEELTHIGRIIPIMRPKADGQAGWAKIRATGFATSRPAVVIDYAEADGTRGQIRRDVPVVDVARPAALAAGVRAGSSGLERIELHVKVDFEQDDREELLQRADEYAVDTRIMTAAQATAMVANLDALRARGLYASELAFHGLGELGLAAGWTWEVGPETQALATLGANGRPADYPSVASLLPDDEDADTDGGELVQWETPIPPPEGHAILARMSAFPEATVYRVGRSYLGKDIWAMDLMPPIEASHWSHYKATTFKPTVVYSARQHANEVSSTSHVLKLAELLLVDEEFKKKLLDVNVVIHPFTNPDGAQLAYDLYEITPDFILHAGYLGSLGMDATSGGNRDMPIYPESKVRPRLWRTWLPDVFLNPHGYPSHEVVQLFSEYAGLVRRGRITERNWSVNRGWFIPSFGYLDDPDFPDHKTAAFEIRDYITRYMNAAPDVVAMNERAYDRYRRYGSDFEPIVYRQDMTDGINIQMPLKGGRAGEGGAFGGGYNPRITIWTGGTEAPDETAYGDWMRVTATAGLQWDKAILDYLYENDHPVERHGSAYWGGAVRLWHHRPRPPEPDDEEGPEAVEGSTGEAR